MRSPLLDKEWKLHTPSPTLPAHIYAGVEFVATLFDHDIAHRLVAEHNSRLLIERGRLEQAERELRERGES